MIRIGVTATPVLFSLLEQRHLHIDYIKVDGAMGLATVNMARRYAPVFLHDLSNEFWLNYENPFDDTLMDNLRAMLEAAQSPWFSTGIGASAEPQGHTTAYWRGTPDHLLQSREKVMSHITHNGRRLQEWLGIPLLLENYNYHPVASSKQAVPSRRHGLFPEKLPPSLAVFPSKPAKTAEQWIQAATDGVSGATSV